MKRERQEDEAPLEDGQVRHVVDAVHRLLEALLPLKGGRVLPQMEDDEPADRDDAGERMQLAPQEGAVVLGKYGLFERCGFGHAGLRGQGGGSDVWEGTGPVKAAAFRVTATARVLVALALVAGALAPLGCSSSKTARTPRAMLSGSVQAEFDFHAIVKDWARADAKARIAMESRLIRFQEQFPDDELVRAADALLAWIELERGDLDAAEVHAFRIQIAGPGEVSDIARVVQGSAVRRKGRPDEGLALLAPLEGKVIDGWSRELLNEELTTTAIAAKKWRRAVHYTAVWLREAEPDQHDLVKARIVEALKVIPPAEIARGLESGHRLAELGLPDAELEVRTLYAQRLAEVAKERHDAVLAQKLLVSSGALLGEHGDSVAALASGQGKARVEPRTVGLLLSLRSEETRRRGVDLAAGVAFGLGLPGSAAHLVSRDDGASIEGVERAMGALSADGASVVIGGVDEAESREMAHFADTHRIPVVLLRPVAGPEAKSPFVFVVGEDPADVDRVLATALASHGAKPVSVVAETTTALAPWEDVTIRRCGDLGAPYKGVAGVVLGAGEGCTRDALAALPSTQIRLAAGFDAQGTPLPASTLRASAGVFPIASTSAPPREMQGWLDARDATPSWFAALGRDAAVLVFAGLQALPQRGTEDPREVTTYRMGAAAALAAAQADLWTSEAKGFGGQHALPRTINVREGLTIGPVRRKTGR